MYLKLALKAKNISVDLIGHNIRKFIVHFTQVMLEARCNFLQECTVLLPHKKNRNDPMTFHIKFALNSCTLFLHNDIHEFV
jgi:hypothetical protein